jgi:ferredoxin-NADP reductase
VFSYVDAEGCVLNLGEFISLQSKELHVYVCGPKPMIDAVIDCCNKHRYRDEYIYWEQFASTVPEDGEASTDVLGKSNQEMKSKVTSQFYK